MKISVIVILSLLALALIITSVKYPNRKKHFWIYLLSGLLSYIICLVIGQFYDVLKLELNMFNLSVSAVGGIPGVAFLYMLKFLL